MCRPLLVKSLFTVVAALAVALVLACSSGEETPAVGSLLELLPQNTDAFTFADLEEVRGERLDDLEEQLAVLIDSAGLEDWEIDVDDADSLVISDPYSADALTILQGDFVLEDVEDALDDDGLRDSDHRGVTVWSERSASLAVALVGENVIVLGLEERIEDSIDALMDEGRSMADDDEAGAIVEALGNVLVYSVAGDCGYRGCRQQASGVRVENRDLAAVFAYLFRDDDAAADAERDIEDDLEDLVDDPRAETDGELVIAESPVDEEQLDLVRNGALTFRLDEDSPARRKVNAPRATSARFGDDHGDNAQRATRIRENQTLEGEIDNSGDRDFFSFRADRGETYVIETHTNDDTIVFLWNVFGDMLDEDDDSGDGGGERLVWTAPESDTYYIDVTGYGGSVANYRVSLYTTAQPAPTQAPASTAAPAPTFTLAPTAVPARPTDDHVNEPSIFDATEIRPGDVLEGNIDYSDDKDVFIFRGVRGGGYRIETHLGSNDDTVLTLYDGAGRFITEDDDSGDETASRLDWTAPSADTYYIEVKGFDGETGSYRLSLDAVERQTTPTAAPEPTQWAPADGRYGGDLRLALAEEPFRDGFSPLENRSLAASRIFSLIFSRLWRVSPSGVEPDLARSWEVSQDGLSWIVRLREDARFHDGRPITAQDVAYSIEAGGPRWRELPGEEVPEVNIIDDITLQLLFENPGSGFLSNRINIVPRGMYDSRISRFTDLLGSGPFIAGEHARNVSVVLKRNSDYYEHGLPYLDTISVYVVPERATRVAVFLTGQTHFLGYPYPSPSSSAFPPLTASERSTIERTAELGVYPVVFALWFDTRSEPFADPRVRRAVNYAINRETLNRVVWAGEPQSVVPAAIFPGFRTRLNDWNLVSEWNVYSPEHAKELLAEAGYPDGIDIVLHTNPIYPPSLQVLAEAVAQMLADVGIFVRIDRNRDSWLTVPTPGGLKLAAVDVPGRNIDRFFGDYFSDGGVRNHSGADVSGDPFVLAEEVYYIPFPAPQYARHQSVRGPLAVERVDLGANLKHVWLER